MRSLLGLWLASLLLAGCANCGGGGEDDGGTDAGLQASELCRDLARQQCDFFIRCHADPFAAISGFQTTDAGFLNRVPESERARCEEAFASDLDCQVVAASIESGRASFTESGYRDCVETAYPADTCDRDAFAALERCRDVSFLDGTVTVGAACALDEDCAGTGFCTAASFEACGTCAAPTNVTGAACTRDAECNPGSHYCTGADGDPGTCQPFKATGAPCTIDDLQQEECGSGSVCTQVGLGFRCDVGRLEGEACELERFQCARSGRGLFELLCAPIVPPNGGTPVNRCVRAQTGPGGACGNGEGSRFGIPVPLCPESQYCLDNVCTPRRAQGEPCTEENECAFGLRCVSPDPGTIAETCQPFVGEGQSCGSSADCAALLSCQEGTCRPAIAVGPDACSSARPCASGSCQGGTCVAPKEDGATCATADECASHRCEGTCQDACWDG